MIAKIKLLEKYCSEYTKIENYEEAVKSPLKYDLHHRREISEIKSSKQLKSEGLYWQRPASELIFLEHGEHIRLHTEGKNLSAETRQRMSNAKKNMSEETRKKISEAMKGKPPHNKGKHCHLENGKRVYPIL